MKIIYLLRHAKSSWDNEKLDDYQRPLTKRGIKSATKIGKFLKKNKFFPGVVYCSKAKRAFKTWCLVNKILKKKDDIFITKELYMASENIFLDFIKNTNDKFKSLLIVSHNPGIENLALSLSEKKEDALYKKIDFKYPTAGLVIIIFKTNKWKKVDYAAGKFKDFIVPREL